jgi:hypothetical protein
MSKKVKNDLNDLTEVFHKLEGGDKNATPKLNASEVYLKHEIIDHINRKSIECNK